MIHTIIFDWKRTLYNPDNKELISGALDILLFLQKKNIPMVLLGKGDETLKQDVAELGISTYFKEIIFVGNTKTESMFAPFIHKSDATTCWIVGDRAQGEIAIAKKLGCTAIWIKQGKFANEEPIVGLEADMTYSSLEEFCAYLTKTLQ